MTFLDSELDRQRILDSTLGTVGIQSGIIRELLDMNERLQSALKASTREIERLSAEIRKRDEQVANDRRIS